MTLSRQLFAGIVAVFAALLIGIEAIYVALARDALEDQLNAHANETATSLALSMGSRMQALDPILVNAIANPVFDRGYFDWIEVRTVEGEIAFSRRLEAVEIEEVPAAFVRLVAFDPPTGRAMVSSGWQELGQVSVRVHPKFAYKQLWETALATLAWLGVLFVLALAGMRAYVAGILDPLLSIEQAALAIGERNFVSVAVAPRARELGRVASAINSLSAKVRDAIRVEAQQTERLRRDAFEDATTGTLNRRGFENAVAAALEEAAEVHSGALALFAVEGLDEINQVAGLARGDEVLRRLCELLAAPAFPAATLVGRWQGPIVAGFVANISRDEAAAWAARVGRSFAESLQSGGLPGTVAVRAGIAHFSAGTANVALLGRLATEALAEAANRPAPVVKAVEESAPPADMRHEIESALAGGRISLLYQPVASLPGGDVLQWELTSQLVDGRGDAIAARTYIPIAGQHGLLAAIDERVLELAIDALARAAHMPAAVSVNIASQTLLDEASRKRILATLERHPQEARRLTFETTSVAAAKIRGAVAGFSRELQRLGSRLALDNFEMDRDAIALVNELMPAYVKLAPVFTHEISTRGDARFILEALLRVFQPLEIPVFAQGVESQEMVATLSGLRLSGYQGYALGRPAPLTW